MFHENSIWTEERDPVNTATQKKKKKSQFQHGKTCECSKSTGVRDVTKATGCGQRDGPSPHICQPCCVQKNSVCSLAHRTGCSSLFNPSFPSPWFSAAPLYQHCPNSPNAGLSICGISEQLSRAGTLGTFSLLSSGSLAPGHLSFSWRMENWHLVSPEVERLLWHKLWNLGCFIFLPFFFLLFFPTEVILSSCQLIHVWIFTEAFVFSWLNQGAEMLPCDFPCSVETNPFASSRDPTWLHLT